MTVANVRALPCSACPHQGACCTYGASLTPAEETAIRAHHGADAIEMTGDPTDPVRTRVLNGACVFLQDGQCRIHAEPYYPRTCAGFPWVDEVGDPYVHDKTICPEFTADEDV